MRTPASAPRRRATGRSFRAPALHDQLRWPLARYALTTPREPGEHRAVPQSDHSLLEEPPALGLHELIVVVAGKAQGIRRLATALGHEREGLHGAMLAAPLHDRLAHVVLAAREARRGGIVLPQTADTLVAFPSIRVIEHLLDDERIGHKTADQGIHIARIQRPGVARNQILDRDAVLDREPAQPAITLTHTADPLVLPPKVDAGPLLLLPAHLHRGEADAVWSACKPRCRSATYTGIVSTSCHPGVHQASGGSPKT